MADITYASISYDCGTADCTVSSDNSTYSTIWTDSGTTTAFSPYTLIDYTTISGEYTLVPAQPEQVDRPITVPSVWITEEFEWHERVLSEDEQAEQLRLAKEAEEKRIIAETRGEDLLKSLVGEVAYHRFKRDGYIDIPSMREVGKAYRIRPNRMIGIVKNGEEQRLSLCIHPDEWGYVVGDLVATHVLLCKFDEERMNQIANHHQRAA